MSSVYVSKAENDRGSASTSNQIIHNPNGSRKKGERNIRRKSTSEKMSNIIRSRKAIFCSKSGRRCITTLS